MKNKQDWEKFIEEIMQDGYDVAMFGDPFMDNVKEKQEKEYNRVVKKHSKFIRKQIIKAREEGKNKWLEMGREAGISSCRPVVNLDDKSKNCKVCGYDHDYINDDNEAWYKWPHAREEAVKDFVGFCLSRDLRPETKGFFMCEKQLYLKSLKDKK